MIIDTFNGTYFAFIGVLVAAIVLIWAVLRNKSENVKKWTIVGICIFNIIFFWIYKYWLSLDTEYLTMSGLEKMNWFAELPLQLCNINMFLIPIGLLTKRRSILGFSFIVAPLAALLAVTTPSLGFAGYDIFLLRNIGFYGTHGLIIICAVSVATLGFFRPKFKDFPGIYIAMTLLSLGIFGINNLLIYSGLCSNANYFYTQDPNAVSVLEVVWKYIPIKYVYVVITGLVVLSVYMVILTLPFELAEKRKAKIEAALSAETETVEVEIEPAEIEAEAAEDKVVTADTEIKETVEA